MPLRRMGVWRYNSTCS